jgi:diadenylate cyclase
LLVVITMILLSSISNLIAFRWLSSSLITGAAIAIPIIFQPEIRRAMERLGRAGLGVNPLRTGEYEPLIEDISQAAAKLSERRHGALIVLERAIALDDFIETGIRLDSEVSPQVLMTIFFPKTELHDGAVILRGDRIACAAAVLPLTAAHGLAQRKVGTRHRAGLGISEISDALVVIISEETGQISIASEGKLIRRIDPPRLAGMLKTFYADIPAPRRFLGMQGGLWEQALDRLFGLWATSEEDGQERPRDTA